jgi:hypothetical protein
MKYLILSFGLIPFALSKAPLIYFIGTQSIVFEKVEDMFLSKKCVDKKCEAYKNSKKNKNAKLDPSWLFGGKNPNSVKCSRILGGEVLIAEDIKGNKQSVCRFKDNSFLL